MSSFWPPKLAILPVRNSTDPTSESLQPREYETQQPQPQTQFVPSTSDLHVVIQKIDEEYESSASFRGASILVNFVYLNIAVFILSGDMVSPSITYIVGAQLWSSALFQPFFHTSWPLYCLWIPKLKLSESRTFAILDFIFLTVFLLANSVPSYQITAEVLGLAEDMPWGAELTANAMFLSEMLGVASLIMIYFIFLGWFTLDSRVRKMKSTQRCWIKILYLIRLRLARASVWE